MPFYEYKCSHCGHYLEAMQKISEAPLKKCPECGKNSLTKLISAPVFRLKGSGWYETDFKSDQERKRNLAGADKETADSGAADSKVKSESDSTGKSDAKPPVTAAGSAPSSSAQPAESPGKTGSRAETVPAASATRSTGERAPASGASRATKSKLSKTVTAARPRTKGVRSGPTRGRR